MNGRETRLAIFDVFNQVVVVSHFLSFTVYTYIIIVTTPTNQEKSGIRRNIT